MWLAVPFVWAFSRVERVARIWSCNQLDYCCCAGTDMRSSVYTGCAPCTGEDCTVTPNCCNKHSQQVRTHRHYSAPEALATVRLLLTFQLYPAEPVYTATDHSRSGAKV